MDQAVEKRSTLKVAMDAEQQQQDLTDYKLHNEQQQNAISKERTCKHTHTHYWYCYLQNKLWSLTLPNTSTRCRSKTVPLLTLNCSIHSYPNALLHSNRSQLLHNLQLTSEQQLEVLEREKAKKLSELHVNINCINKAL